MLKLFIQITGWLVAHSPRCLLRLICRVLGRIVLLIPRRRHLTYSNLHHAFPEKPRAWHHSIARTSSERLIETALLSLATPFLSRKRLLKIVTAGPGLSAAMDWHKREPAAALFCTPHFAYWEILTSMPLIVDAPFPEFGVIYRPLKNPTLDAWVKRTRERFGMKLFSRREGFTEAMKTLRRQGALGLLFDQNAGGQGSLTTLFGRTCSTSELSGLLAAKFKARTYGLYARRLGFWEIEMNADFITHDGTATSTVLALNQWLETKLSTDDNLCASWLWSHDRWRQKVHFSHRLTLNHAKHDLLPEDIHFRQWAALPRRTRIWIRMPNWLGDVVMALPALQTLRASRPDIELTLISKPAFIPLLQRINLADHIVPLPPKGIRAFISFYKMRYAYPDTYILLTHSQRGDIEAWLTNSYHRHGIEKFGHPRPLLTQAYKVPAEFDEKQHHQLELTEKFFRHLGLVGPLNYNPLKLSPSPAETTQPTNPAKPAALTFGLIAGSENTPAKRWPVNHWRDLINLLAERYPHAHFQLLGTAKDRPITDAIAQNLPHSIENLAGNTNLNAYLDLLTRCTLLITNDTGGMHLANAIGTPLIALFGPTNPIRTGPVFSTPHTILQPPGCPKEGGGDLNQLLPATVAQQCHIALAPAIHTPQLS